MIRKSSKNESKHKKRMSYRQPIWRNENVIRIERMDHYTVVSEFIKSMYHGLKRGYKEFILDFENIRQAYPAVRTPIAGIIEYHRGNDIDFEIDYASNSDGYLSTTHISSPLTISENVNVLSRASLDNVWRFRNFEDVQNLVDAFIKEVAQSEICETGVLEGLTWCLNEVMDNVLQHSIVECGYAMGQIHQSKKRIAFCVYDYGQGIYNSLKNSSHSPRHPIDAITLAIKEGITRDRRIGQGNGMWGLHNIVKSNLGRLVITSCSASYMLRGNEIQTFNKVPYLSKKNGGTIVDFQLDYSKGISIAEALGGHTPVNLKVFQLQSDEGLLTYKISEKASGTGTGSPKRVRTRCSGE